MRLNLIERLSRSRHQSAESTDETDGAERIWSLNRNASMVLRVMHYKYLPKPVTIVFPNFYLATYLYYTSRSYAGLQSDMQAFDWNFWF